MDIQALNRNPHEDRLRLSIFILDQFNEDEFISALGLKKRPGIKEYNPAVVTEQFRALSLSGLLEIRGDRVRASYRLTPLGVEAKHQLREMIGGEPELA